jgi:PAS domain S-box-containing protein
MSASMPSSGESLAAALDSIAIGAALMAADARVVRANQPFCDMLGYSHDELQLMAPGELLHPNDRSADMADRERLLRGEAPTFEAERRYRHRDGGILWMRLTCVVTRAPGQGAAGFVDQLVDITAQKLAASERQRAEKEIVLVNNVLEERIRKRTAELEESNEDLRDFAYSLAHDLRAPLASIDGFSAQLETRLAGTLDEKGRHYLNRVRAGVRLMSDFTDALLALADLSNTQLMHEPVDLSAVARNIVDRMREHEPERKVRVVIEGTPRAQGDERLLTDVMQNLLGNAWKFTSKKELAEIRFGGEPSADGSWRYHVKDNGAGFDPAHADKLFGPFQRLHPATEFRGTGIGLAIVRKIVSRHGGRVWAESQPGQGASFFFTLNEKVPPRVARDQNPEPLQA